MFGPEACLLVALGPALGATGAQKEVMLNPARLYRSGALTRREQGPPAEVSILQKKRSVISETQASK